MGHSPRVLPIDADDPVSRVQETLGPTANFNLKHNRKKIRSTMAKWIRFTWYEYGKLDKTK